MELWAEHTYCGRYQVVEVLPPGGMARVAKVVDSHSNRLLALKIQLGGSSDAFAELAFQREYEALSNLSHPNIVELVDSGRTDEGDLYLALEWLPTCLGDMLRNARRWEWEDFYADIGAPLLEALAAAHVRQIAHRDIKPDNLRFDTTGTLKVTDYGIAKARSSIGIGKTFKNAGSPPYTPPEADDDTHSFARDTYSWGAVAIACLSGQDFGTYHDLRAALDSLSIGSTPAEILARCISLNPAGRPVNAVDLLAQVEAYHAHAVAGKSLPIWVQIGQKELTELSAALGGKSVEESITELQKDLNGSLHGYIVDEQDRLVRLIGISLDITCKAQDRDVFRVTSIRPIGIERAESERRQCCELPGIHVQVFPALANISNAANQRAFLARISVHQHQRDLKLKRAAEERWFDVWSAVLREKERQQREKRTELRFTAIRQEGQNYIATCEGDIPLDAVPESLVYRFSSGQHAVLQVLGVFGDEVTLRPQNLVGVPIPARSGVLESNFFAQTQPLIRQRNALDSVRRGEAASPKLKSLICSPSTAALPEFGGIHPGVSGELNEEKRELVSRVLGIRSAFLVEGPPGTGKTTFIAELVRLFLETFPESRVLLSSQTHTALDHIIVKLREKGLDALIVRVHGDRLERIDPRSLPLTLEQKTKAWIETVEKRAREYVQRAAAEIGVDSSELEVAVLGEQRHILLLSIRYETERLEALSTQLDARKSPDDPEDDVIRTTTLLDQKAEIEDSLKSYRARLKNLEARLLEYGTYGKELATSNEQESREWISVLSNTRVPEAAALKEQIQLQLDWFSRLGASRKFHGAVLGEARIVAGTCVGLGNVQAIGEQEFDLCIVDEASKATATETLIPMNRSKRWVLVGDPKQLPPFPDLDPEKHVELYAPDEAHATLLDIFSAQLPPECKAQLTEQRRMVRGIGRLISDVFYESTLVTVRDDKDRNGVVRKMYPREVQWHSTSRLPHKREEEMPGKTFRNRTEALLVHRLLVELDRANKGKSLLHVAVIAGYSAQVNALDQRLKATATVLSNLRVEINTVDAFQGRDADICIYSVTRSNDRFSLGFQREVRRLNVALSRGRDALVIVGDDQFCRRIETNNPFRSVLTHIDQHPTECEVISYDRL
jgi:hypothetical protein